MKTKGIWLFVISIVIFLISGMIFVCAFLFTSGENSSSIFSEHAVAVIEIKGGIFDSKEIVDELDRVYNDDKLKALILRIDSPGGAVSPSQEIYEAVLRVKEKKKVVVSMGTVAASGGYYIAVAADKIVANPGSITGSIGVLMDYTNLQDLLNFLKIHAEILKAGEMKDIGSPLRPLSPEDRQYLQGLLNNMHRQFKVAVAQGRHMTIDQVDKFSDGRVFTGEEALSLKLVDALGGQRKAVEIVKEMLGLKEDPDLFYPKKKSNGLLDLFSEGQAESKLLHWIYFLREGRALYWTKGMTI